MTGGGGAYMKKSHANDTIIITVEIKGILNNRKL